jgi:Tol biopolymer transport system component
MDGLTWMGCGRRRVASVLLAGLAVGVSAPASAVGPTVAHSAALQCSGRGPAHSNGRLVVHAHSRYSIMGPGERLYTVRPDGSGRRVLTRPTRSETDVAIEAAPDGRRVAIARYRNGRGASIKLVTLSTGRVRSVLSGARVIATAPVAWSPDGDWLAFTLLQPDEPATVPPEGLGPLGLVHPDGSGLRYLPPSVTQARWSPNGRCLVGYSENGIGVASPSGVLLQTFQRPFAIMLGMTFTPDGRRLLFHAAAGRYTTQRPAIYSSGLDGANRRRLTKTRGAGEPFVVSPDRRWLAYSDRRGTLVRPIGGGPARRLLTGLHVMAWAPAPTG